jgi:hypothetical protein
MIDFRCAPVLSPWFLRMGTYDRGRHQNVHSKEML